MRVANHLVMSEFVIRYNKSLAIDEIKSKNETFVLK